ncbi:MAG: rhomboid family intrarane serine protease [Ferruginibacter sp.]|uniref:rhomboid family intramembrane serine protease n=1 Tax=Ferruginibacter sp. TaxID=1940288 RepID=UPI0026591B2C|nr:rhomboid family intramembrane serine protease [Ferruginibacter sp.]MDB5279354.1 rhomboid family intrarane serine protease [Ferruginibacter sp.]
MSVTIIIIAITCIVSFICFNNEELMDKLIFYPPAVSVNHEWYRFFSCGIIHKDIPHLLFNMYALYLFGQGQHSGGVEFEFVAIFGSAGKLFYILMYVAAFAVCLIPTYMTHKDNYQYKSLGASGAVSAVVFAFILFNPMQGVGLIFIPVFIPGFLFGILYLVISYLLARKGNSNINHSAHIWGGLFGIGFIVIFAGIFGHYPVVANFLEQVKTVRLDNLFSTY